MTSLTLGTVSYTVEQLVAVVVQGHPQSVVSWNVMLRDVAPHHEDF